MITDADIAKLKIVFVTKDDLSAMEKRQKDERISFKDAILKEISDMRDEVALVIGYKDQIEDHEDRIELLEKIVKVSPSL